MEKGKEGITPLSKPVVKRSRSSPWQTAAASMTSPMVKRSVMKAVQMHHRQKGPATSPQPARIVSDIMEPSAGLQKAQSGTDLATEADNARREKEKEKKAGSEPNSTQVTAPQTHAPETQDETEQKTKASLSNHSKLARLQQEWEAKQMETQTQKQKEAKDSAERSLSSSKAPSASTSSDDDSSSDDEEDIPARAPSRLKKPFILDDNDDEGDVGAEEEEDDTPKSGIFDTSKPLVLANLHVKDDENDEDYRDDKDDDDDDQSTDTDSSESSNEDMDVSMTTVTVTAPLGTSADADRRTSHVPLPPYAFPLKRAAPNVGEPEPPAKRHSSATFDQDTEHHQSSVPEKAKKTDEMEASKILAARLKETASTPLTKETLQAQQQPEPLHTQSNDANLGRQTSDLGWVEIDGKTVPIIASTEGRSYRDYKAPDGTIQSACGGLIPDGYALLDDSEAPWICPVRDCRKMLPKLLSLGSHFAASHKKIAFNDNGDATLSPVAEYQQNSSGKTMPAVVVSKRPISPDASPPADPSFPVAHAYRVEGTAKPQVTQRTTQSPLPVGDPEVLSSRSRGHSGPRDYMHRHLSAEQKTPSRADVEHMLTFRRQRDLPGKWLKRHHGTILDEHEYACAVAFMVGEEMTTKPCSQGFKTSHLSNPCIVLPKLMPSHLAELFGKPNICVGCRYWSHLQRQKPRCDYISDSGSVDHGVGRMKRKEVIRRLSRTSSVPTSQSEDTPMAGTTSQAVVSRTTIQQVSAPEAQQLIAERYTENQTSSRAQGSVAMVNVISQGDVDDGMPRMEDWEFAPGRRVDDTTRETIAFSAVYLTGSQPVTIADDISFNRLRIPPGGMNVWKADDNSLRYCEIVKGKLEIKVGETQSLTIGPGGVFIMRPGMACTAENRRYEEAILSCHTNANYSLMPGV